MTANKLRILITRPQQQGQVLATKLAELGFTALSQPMFYYQTRSLTAKLQQQLAAKYHKTIVFVSVAAVHHANIIFPLINWQNITFIAVGEATKNALKDLTEQVIICPALHTSEGLLALTALSDVSGQHIIIVRGNGGRELLAQSLLQRGANVSYFESYQRVWHKFPSDIHGQWQAAKINCIVLTSRALLERLIDLISPLDNHWKNSCLWIVASQRIADNAQQLGLKHVINAQGANDEAIIACITSQ
jgi:uroporphyrinogen-III synthase